MKPLKPAQFFSSGEQGPQQAKPVLKARAEFDYADWQSEPEAVAEPLTAKPAVLSKLIWLALFSLVVLACWQWVDTLVISWQQNTLKGVIFSLLSTAVLVVALWLLWREWRLWRRLQQNSYWQRSAARIAQSVQYGEADVLCQDIIRQLPATPTLHITAQQWQEAAQPQHSDLEKLQLLDKIVLEPLDTQAKAIVWRAGTDTSLAVAVIPFALIDMLMVVWRSSRMVRQLAALYGAPVGQLRSLVMLKRALAAILWAGGSELALDMASDVMSSELTAKLSARAGHGVIAGMLVARLGNMAMQQLRPLPLAEKQRINVAKLSQSLIQRLRGQNTASES
ncbi:putative membrane protein [Arsukibacterium tuosuense]|uniref:Putative membrane protein n=1 Tax=Arsukibacterium tuosuense TaxID=1323745 RepID=A0A285J657_9GAMM|nr:TIGR01620 family protein [Arsukibacterium tuosuense]SNY55543.1 putative membrane protein [Arsukibacterium tuosuense]